VESFPARAKDSLENARHRSGGGTGIAVAWPIDGSATMLDRQQLEALLAKRFPGSSPDQIAAAANAIMAMIRTAGNPVDAGSPVQNAHAH
jgi:hypothetical protein